MIPMFEIVLFNLALIAVMVVWLSSRAEFADYLQTSVRISKFGIVKHTFKSVYKRDNRCPDKIKFYEKPMTVANVGHISLSDIKEDGERCSGKQTTTFKVATHRKMKAGKFLLESGFRTAYDGFQRNSLAQDTLAKWKRYDSLVVGFDDGYRKCGHSKQSNQTFWFFVREPTPIEIDVQSGTKLSFTNITIPKNVRTLFFTDGRKKLCVLVDKTTSKGKKVMITNQSYGGVGQPVPGTDPSSLLVPLNSSEESSIEMDTSEDPYEYPSTDDGNEASSFPGMEPGGISPPGPSPQVQESRELSSSTCFPTYARVELESGQFVPISRIHIGDRIRTGATTFSDVFMFTHREKAVSSKFLRISTASNDTITLTPSHYLHGGGNLIAASVINVGDNLILANGTQSKVISIESVILDGLYNPHTLDGNIIVDGILASTYTTSISPILAHDTLLVPLRWLYNSRGAVQVLKTISSVIGRNADTLSRTIPCGDYLAPY